MFTGIIKAKGSITAMNKQGGDVRLTVRSDGLPWGDYEIGESIAVNGVCLTAVVLHEDGFDSAGYDLLAMMHGSEGMLGIVVEAQIE